MHIKNRTAMVLLDLAIGVLAALATWIQFLNFGNDAWRLFATWVALLVAVYYILDALITFFAKHRAVGAELSPMLQGGLIVAGIVLLIAHIVCYVMDSYIPVVGINVVIIDFILPIMMVISWVIFSEKGKWRAYDPFYWLGLIAVYVSIILFTGELMPRSARLIYPYEFLDYPSIGIDVMLWWFAILAVVVLIIGFLFWLLDFSFSGQLSQHIVMPKIKTIVIEEEIEEPAELATSARVVAPKTKLKSEVKNAKRPTAKSHDVSKDKSQSKPKNKPDEKPVKLVTTGGRNVLPAKAESRPEKQTSVKTTESKDQKDQEKQNNQNKSARIIEHIDVKETKKKSNGEPSSRISAKSKGENVTQPATGSKQHKEQVAVSEKSKKNDAAEQTEEAKKPKDNATGRSEGSKKPQDKDGTSKAKSTQQNVTS